MLIFSRVVHPYVRLYHDYGRYGGAQTLTLMVQVKQGDIYNEKTLKKIQDISLDVDLLPAVVHQSIRSLASYRVTYVTALPGNLVSKAYMYPDVPKTKADIDELRRQINIHRQEIRYLVSDDGRSAAIVASFTEGRLNYHELFDKVQEIVKKYSDNNTDVFAAGEPMIRGYGYYYLPTLVTIFFISDGIMILILYALLSRPQYLVGAAGDRYSRDGLGTGFIGLEGFEFDPVMLVIRFILTARDMSHGIQWQGRYYDELEARNYDKHSSIAATTTLMLPPGMLSILADIAGIVFISFGGIPSLQHVASSGAVWLGGSLTMVFIFQPIMMSYLKTPPPLKVTPQRRPLAVDGQIGGLGRGLPRHARTCTRGSTGRGRPDHRRRVHCGDTRQDRIQPARNAAVSPGRQGQPGHQCCKARFSARRRLGHHSR